MSGSREQFRRAARECESAPDEVPGTPSLDIAYDDVRKGNVLGRGGLATVFEGSARADGEVRVFALKEPHVGTEARAEVAEMFETEAATWAKLDDHPNVVGVLDWGTDPKPWIALEFADGGDLSAYLGEFPADRALWTAAAVADGVRHAHRHGVMHFDLKPENVLLRETDGWAAPKVSDWGFARLLLDHSGRTDGVTIAYAAPEQFDEETFGEMDDRTDIYQLGALAYALLTGVPPAVAAAGPDAGRNELVEAVLAGDYPAATAVDPTLPPAVDRVLRRALRQAKSDRYETVREFRDRLERLFVDVRGVGAALPSGPAVRPRGEWTFDAGGPVGGSPVVVGDTALVAARSGLLHGVSVHSGAPEWPSIEFESALAGAPNAADGIATVATEDGTLFGVDVASGEEAWRVETDWRFRVAPVVAGDTVLIPGLRGTVLAASLDGSERWRSTVAGNVHAAPAVRGDAVAVATFDGVTCLGVEDGRVRWSAGRDPPYRVSPAFVGDTVYVGGDTAVSALAAEDGSERWRTETDATVTGTAVADAGGSVYVGTEGGTLLALDAADGSERWRSTRRGRAVTAPAVGEDAVFVGCFAPDRRTLNGRVDDVVAVRREDGEAAWTHATPEEVPHAPVPVGDRLLVPCSDGRVYALE